MRRVMPSFLDPSAIEDVPPETPELDALRLFVEAYIDAEGAKKGQRLLASAVKIMRRREEHLERVVELLPPNEREAKAKIRRQTRAWFRQSMAVWMARLDGFN
jgi:hypothetical protein